jgi:phosphoglycerate dehydrogenase-like enzyme
VTDGLRILLSAVAHDRFWRVVGREDAEPVLLARDGQVLLGDGRRVPPDAVDAEVAWGTGDLFVQDGVSREFFSLISRAPSLRWLQSPTAGFDGPPFGALVRRGVRITSTHVNGIPIAEYVVRAVLDHFQGAAGWRDAQTRREWAVREYREIYGSTWLVVGLGSIGGAVARRVAAFGASVIGCRRIPTLGDPVDRVVTLDDLPSVIGEADVVVLAAPSNAETRGLVDDQFLAAMKPRSVLVNVARGSLVDERALLAALDRGTPEAAILDVFATEPLPPDHPFWTHPAVTVTPHNAALGVGRLRRQADLFADNLQRFMAGEPLIGEVTEVVRDLDP